MTVQLASFRLSLKHLIFLRNRGKTDVSVGWENASNNWSCLAIDKMILALGSFNTDKGLGVVVYACGISKMWATGIQGVLYGAEWTFQSESPSLGNKYLVAMETLKVDEGWINQNTVNPFYKLPKKSGVTWTLWSVSSYSSLHHTGNPPWTYNDTHWLFWVLCTY